MVLNVWCVYIWILLYGVLDKYIYMDLTVCCVININRSYCMVYKYMGLTVWCESVWGSYCMVYKYMDHGVLYIWILLQWCAIYMDLNVLYGVLYI